MKNLLLAIIFATLAGCSAIGAGVGALIAPTLGAVGSASLGLSTAYLIGEIGGVVGKAGDKYPYLTLLALIAGLIAIAVIAVKGWGWFLRRGWLPPNKRNYGK